MWANELEDLPESIGNLSNLEKLYAGNNRLTQLPESIGRLEAIKELILTNNQLTVLPESIKELKTLGCLRLDDNPVAGQGFCGWHYVHFPITPLVYTMDSVDILLRKDLFSIRASWGIDMQYGTEWCNDCRIEEIGFLPDGDGEWLRDYRPVEAPEAKRNPYFSEPFRFDTKRPYYADHDQTGAQLSFVDTLWPSTLQQEVLVIFIDSNDYFRALLDSVDLCVRNESWDKALVYLDTVWKAYTKDYIDYNFFNLYHDRIVSKRDRRQKDPAVVKKKRKKHQ